MENRLQKLEVMVNRLARRSRKTAKAMITPYPISACVSGEDVKGEVLKYMFPADGVITKCIVSFDRKIKEGVVITIDKISDGGRTKRDFEIDKKEVRLTPNIGMLTGNKIIVSVEAIDPEEKINEVWISFLWAPHVCETEVKQCLLSELDAVEKEFKERK